MFQVADGEALSPGREGAAERRIFCLFRRGTLPPVPVARFTDRGDALRVARDVEQLGWLVSVLSRTEGRDRAPSSWKHEYRSERRRHRRSGAS